MDNVFVVPIDAIGTNDAGESIVFVKESGSGSDAIFKEVVVTTGEENDYYVEISSAELSEGMEVRSSADPKQAQVSGSESSEPVQMNGDMQIDMGGAMPSGEMPAGQMPAGGSGGNGGGAPGGRGGNG